MKQIAILTLLAVPVLWAQAEAVNARLTGTILDPAEAAVPDALVTLANPAAGFERRFTTGADGRYLFPQVPPGRYQLKVEKPGFAAGLQPDIVLAVGQSSTLDVRLELGALTEVIVVQALPPLLNTGNANLGSEVSTRQVLDLPLNQRNVFNLVLLDSSVNNSQQQQALT
jgi:hypothetical protein